jgi:hypothetical protein
MKFERESLESSLTKRQSNLSAHNLCGKIILFFRTQNCFILFVRLIFLVLNKIKVNKCAYFCTTLDSTQRTSQTAV